MVDIPGNDNALKLFNKDGKELNLSAFQKNVKIDNADGAFLSDYYKEELVELLKLSGSELYHKEKLERLKELSFTHFKVKYKEAFGIEYPDLAATSLLSQSDIGSLDLNKAVIDTELSDLIKLSGTDLYYKDKLERLKELSVPHFKIKYQEAFGLEYPC